MRIPQGFGARPRIEDLFDIAGFLGAIAVISVIGASWSTRLLEV